MRVEQGDIEELFRTHRERLTGFCSKFLGSRQAAEDVVQDVFLEACSKPNTPITLAWLCACARNRCIDLHRRRGLWDKLKTCLVSPQSKPSFEKHLVERELGWNLLSALPEKMRTSLVLRAYMGMSYQEISEVLEITPESVGVLLSRARKRAGELMQQEMNKT